MPYQPQGPASDPTDPIGSLTSSGSNSLATTAVDLPTVAERRRAFSAGSSTSRVGPGDVVVALGAILILVSSAFDWFTLRFDFGALYTGMTALRAWDYVGGIVALAAAVLALLGIAAALLRLKITTPLPAGAHYLFLGALALMGAGVYLYRANAILTAPTAGIAAHVSPALLVAIGGAALMLIGGGVTIFTRARS